MKKRHLIIIVVQAIVIAMMFIYAFIQKLEADKNLLEAQRQEKIATEAMRLAKDLKLEVEQLRQAKGQ